MRDQILTIINYRPGINGVSLAMAVMEKVNPVKFNYIEFGDALISLIKEGEIIEIEYKVHDQVTRSIYFPKGTEVKVA